MGKRRRNRTVPIVRKVYPGDTLPALIPTDRFYDVEKCLFETDALVDIDAACKEVSLVL